MKTVYKTYAYVACPHTAVGLEGVARYRAATGDLTPTIVLATAHPAKFPDAVEKALGIAPPQEATLEALIHGETAVEALEPTVSALREVLL